MAVESRFVVIRNGVEVETFMDKKAADEYDKMLDMADNLSEMFAHAPIDLTEDMQEELSIFLAQRREDVLIALQAKKPKPAAKPVVAKDTITEESTENKDVVTTTAKKAKATTTKTTTAKTKKLKAVGDDKLSEAS